MRKILYFILALSISGFNLTYGLQFPAFWILEVSGIIGIIVCFLYILPKVYVEENKEITK